MGMGKGKDLHLGLDYRGTRRGGMCVWVWQVCVHTCMRVTTSATQWSQGHKDYSSPWSRVRMQGAFCPLESGRNIWVTLSFHSFENTNVLNV